MAVQAHHFLSSKRFPPQWANVVVLEDNQFPHFGTTAPAAPANVVEQHQDLMARTVLSGQQSELTCNNNNNNINTSKKRVRDEPPIQHLHAGKKPNTTNDSSSPLLFFSSAGGLNLFYNNHGNSTRLGQSNMTSTSGRASFAPELIAQANQQSLQIDTLVRLHNERLRSGIQEANRRYCRALVSALDQELQRRLLEKELELEIANRRNHELEDKVKQVMLENQVWFTAAKNSEAAVASLRASLEQVLSAAPAVDAAASEGYGDSDFVAAAAGAAGDEGSCCFEEEAAAAERSPAAGRRRCCKVCGEKEVSVLLLPCRHLCLCKECESKIDTCPVCSSVRNASLQVFTS